MREAQTGFTTTIVRNLDDLRQLAGEWRALALACQEIPIFQLPEWVLPWWSYFGAGRQLYCIAIHHSGNLVGLAPFMLHNRFGLRTLSFIGSPLNDRNSFVVTNTNPSHVRQAILQCLLEHAVEWDVLDLANIDAGSVPEWQEALVSSRKQGSPRGAYAVLRPTPRPVIPLPGSWEGYWDSVSSKRRKDLKRRERQLERDHDASYGLALTPSEVASELPMLLDLKRRSWQERKKLSRMNQLHLTPAFAGFLRDACVQLAEQHLVAVAYITAQGTLIASRVAFRAGSTLICYQRSYDPRFSRYAPGMLLDLRTIHYAIESGLSTLDCGTGDETYKFALGALPTFNQNLVVASPGMRGRILLGRRRIENQAAVMRDTHVVPLLHRWGWHTPTRQGHGAIRRSRAAERTET